MFRPKLRLGESLTVRGRELENEPLLGDEGSLFFASWLTFGPPSVDATFDAFRIRIIIVSEKLIKICDCIDTTTSC